MRHGKARQQGFTLIAVMVALALLALATQGVVLVLSHQAQREREAELLRLGQEYIRAIGSYYESSPGSVKTFPRELIDLVDDPRFVSVKRHLRRVYDDPVARRPMEVIRRADGSIEGVYSGSEQLPVRSGHIDLDGLQVDASSRYSEWKFVYAPRLSEGTRR